jgi:hypothetical protein
VSALNVKACEKMLRPKQTMLSFFTKAPAGAPAPATTTITTASAPPQGGPNKRKAPAQPNGKAGAGTLGAAFAKAARKSIDEDSAGSANAPIAILGDDGDEEAVQQASSALPAAALASSSIAQRTHSAPSTASGSSVEPAQQRQLGGVTPATEAYCPVCGMTFKKSTNNVEINQHVDMCLKSTDT